MTRICNKKQLQYYPWIKTQRDAVPSPSLISWHVFTIYQVLLGRRLYWCSQAAQPMLDGIIAEGFRQKRRQRSSLLFGGQNVFNSLPRYLFRTIWRKGWIAPGWYEEKVELILIFKLSWCKKTSGARNWVNSAPNSREYLCLLFWINPSFMDGMFRNSAS